MQYFTFSQYLSLRKTAILALLRVSCRDWVVAWFEDAVGGVKVFNFRKRYEHYVLPNGCWHGAHPIAVITSAMWYVSRSSKEKNLDRTRIQGSVMVVWANCRIAESEVSDEPWTERPKFLIQLPGIEWIRPGLLSFKNLERNYSAFRYMTPLVSVDEPVRTQPSLFSKSRMRVNCSPLYMHFFIWSLATTQTMWVEHICLK